MRRLLLRLFHKKVCRSEVDSSSYAMPEVSNQLFIQCGQMMVYLEQKMWIKIACHEAKSFISSTYITSVRIFVANGDKAFESCSDLEIAVASRNVFQTTTCE